MTEIKPFDELTEREQLELLYWDVYKDAHGFRPRHVGYHDLTNEQLRVEILFLEEQARLRAAELEADEKAAIAIFETRVQGLMTSLCIDRATAYRWLRQAENAEDQPWEYFCYLMGLPYGYFASDVAAQ